MILISAVLLSLAVTRAPEVSKPQIIDPSAIKIEWEPSQAAVRRVLIRLDDADAHIRALEQFRHDSIGLLIDTAGMTTCAGADLWTTGHFRANPKLRESNPLIGDSPEQHIGIKLGFLGFAVLVDAGARMLGHPQIGRGFAGMTCTGFVTSALWNTALDRTR